MRKTLELLTDIVPECMAVLKLRLDILNVVKHTYPIGRRKLAEFLNKSERTIRTEVDHLKSQQLVTFVSKGIVLTEKGMRLLQDTLPLYESSDEELYVMAESIKRLFRIKACKVVKGSVDNDIISKNCFEQFGRVLTDVLDKELPVGNNTIAVTGGTTLSKVVRHVESRLTHDRTFDIVSARGSGVGSPIIQSTMVGHLLSTQLSGNNYTLAIPEQLSSSLYEPLLKEPTVVRVLEKLHHANCLLYSVGSAETMLERRGVSQEDWIRITKERAVGEALGVFFNEKGQIVHRLARIGLELEDLEKVPLEILIVAGQQKLQALTAYMEIVSSKTILIIDEALAKLVLNEHKL